MTFVVDGTNGLTFNDATTQSSTATNASNISSGTLGKARLPTGSVLQVVNGTYSTQTSTTSGTFVTTNLKATITPNFTTSKIAIFITTGDTATTGSNAGVGIGLYRAGSQIVGNLSSRHMAINSSGALNIGQWSTCYLDSPATTSSTLYELYFNNGGGGTALVFRDNTQGSIILMEIAA